MKLSCVMLASALFSVPAFAGGPIECVARAELSSPRTIPQAASGTGPTETSARKDALRACLAVNGSFANGCTVTRCQGF